MEKVKKLRSCQRSTVTKTVNKLEAELAKQPIPKQSLQATLRVLDSHMQKLEAIDEQYKDLLLEDTNVTEEEFQKECDTMEDYLLKTALIKIKVEEVLLPAPTEDANTSRSSSHNMSGSFSNQEDRYVKLPKLELKKFSGEIKDWLTFWNQFKKVHENDKLNDADKFHYLDQCMIKGSRAAELVSSYPYSSENYAKAVKALEERFGNPDILQQYYVRELMALVMNRNRDKQRLSTLYDKLESHIRNLESLGVSVKMMVLFLSPMVESCLPEDILIAWQRSADFTKDGSKENPPVSQLDLLMGFLKKEIDAEEKRRMRMGFGSIGNSDKKKANTQNEEYSEQSLPTAAGLFSGSSPVQRSCVFCDKSNHESKDCYKAKKMTIEEKKAKIKETGSCFRCLKIGHMASQCKMKVKCGVCNRQHFPVLCPGKVVEASKPKDVDEKTQEKPKTLLTNLNCTSQVLLRTLIVQVKNPSSNKKKNVRVLLDCGSQRSYILKETAKELGCEAEKTVLVNHHLFGGTKVNAQNHQILNVNMCGMKGENPLSLKLMDQLKICADVPRVADGDWVAELESKGVSFSDRDSSRPLEIEVLIGADYLGDFLTGNILKLKNGLTVTETRFGWTVMGKVKTTENLTMTVISMAVSCSTVQELWDLETIGILDPAETKSREIREKEVQINFENTVTKNQDGRYCVTLPWVGGLNELPTNKAIAIKRLETTTRKLNSLSKFHEYDRIFKDWEKEGIVSTVQVEEDEKECHFLPHRAVIKDSKTTPVRPVFDASCKTGKCPSLNNCLEKGPNLLELIPSLLMRFRMGKIGVIADIRKAFLMIEVNPADRRFLRFLWWEDSKQQKVKVYEHNRVVFGVSSSPFLLGAVVAHHLRHCKITPIDLLKKLENSFYVDNLVTTVDSDEEFETTKKTATDIFVKAKMELRQWERSGICDSESVTTVLGHKWDKVNDLIGFCSVSEGVSDAVTKRVILSQLHSIFDPLGFLCPILIIPKILLQRAWMQNKKWDEEVDDKVKTEFKQWYEEVSSVLPLLHIPRNCDEGRKKGEGKFEIHSFCDASNKAYAAVVFLRVEAASEVKVHLLQAKTRVAPLQKVSIPRLELLSCTISARLTASVKKALDLEDVPTFFWTDSTTALSWITRENQWGTFVANRVKEIGQLSGSEQWNHVPGTMNPADLPSRGISPKKFVELRWWEGPSWLTLPKEEWPNAVEKPN